jgi:hypothetical protein
MSRRKKKASRVRDNVIPFPAREAPADDWTFEDAAATVATITPDIPVEDPPDWADGFTFDVAVAEAEDEHEEPDAFTESDGQWVWVPTDQDPASDVPVGMIAHRVATMCKWTYRHIMEEQPIPQPCCYSVLITTKRLPGPVREARSYLAQEVTEP